jgi:hypothetical protein
VRNSDTSDIGNRGSQAYRSLIVIVGYQGDLVSLAKNIVAKWCFEDVGFANKLGIISDDRKVMSWMQVLIWLPSFD